MAEQNVQKAPTIPEVLAQHQRITSKPGGPCWCGEWPRDDERRDTWMDHVAAALAPLLGDMLARARADVLREHADREVEHEGFTMAVERLQAHAHEHDGYLRQEADRG